MRLRRMLREAFELPKYLTSAKAKKKSGATNPG